MMKKAIVLAAVLCSCGLASAQTLIVASDTSGLTSLSKSEVRQLYMGQPPRPTRCWPCKCGLALVL